tara:strand:+ start:356 stop:613 length:258 start_codon:yes stop_codon:yes gene_type:complete
MKPVTNALVAEAWALGQEARNHNNSFYTDGKRIYSYGLQVGDTGEKNKKIVRDYTKNGSYGFRSMTTSTHVGLLRYIRGHETIVV